MHHSRRLSARALLIALRDRSNPDRRSLKCPPCALRVFVVFGRACSLLCLACLPLLSALGQRNALSRLDVPQQFVVEYEKFDDMEK
jgi:hypothetical protein